MSLKLGDPVTKIKYIREQYAKLLAKLAIETTKDLVTHFPSYYIDSSNVTKIKDIAELGKVTVRVKILEFKNIYTKSHKQLQQALVGDDSGTLKVIWFFQPFLSRTLKKGTEVFLYGEIKADSGKAVMQSPDYEVVGKTTPIHLGRISSVYPLTRGVTLKWIKKRIWDSVNTLEAFKSPTDKYFEQPSFAAIKQIHFPDNQTSLELARNRLSHEELISILLKVERIKKETGAIPGIQINSSNSLVYKFIKSLPFELTSEQLKSIDEITKDLEKPAGMNRLLQGDVGSGKTVVAIAAALACVESGYQVAILAPTVILAEQHYLTIKKLLAELKLKIGLVTASNKSNEKSDIYVGTSAVLARKHNLFTKLGLVIVDEQHRFGVNQRLELKKLLEAQGDYLPNLLDMTATPIPRSIALTFFGDMELSRIKAKPVGRLPIETRLVPSEKRQGCYDWIAVQLATGRQVYWVCPLIEESELREAKAAETTFAELEKVFKKFKVGLLHGRMKDKQKNEVMQQFKDQEINLLVATTVIEVGIDVPNATVMVIEDADLMGLAQLHQIRGRVGRSSLQSWCFIFESSEISDKGRERLDFFASHHDGLEIAEYDLQNRGPGEVYGTRQSGIPDLKIAKLNDYEMIAKAKKIAQELIEKNLATKLPLFARE